MRNGKMIYHSFRSSSGINVEISSFAPPGEARVTEHNLTFSTKDCDCVTKSKVEAIVYAYREIVGNELLGEDVKPVFVRWFLSDASNQSQEIDRDIFKCACSIIEQPPVDGSKIAIWLYCQSRVTVTKEIDNLYSVRHGSYRHLWLGDRFLEAVNSEEATKIHLNNFARDLKLNGCMLSHNCQRTWYFVRDIDVNYPGMVKGRNDVFKNEGLTSDSHFIASTGIGGSTANAKECVSFNAYAVEGIKGEQVNYLKGKTHLNPTMEYGVSFERGTTVDYGDRRVVFISGTASIDNKGNIIHQGNVLKQTERVLENIEVLLKEADADWSDVGHLIVYMRDFSDHKIISEIMEKNLPRIPKIIVQAPVCRSGWLVEMECMAIKSVKWHDFSPL